MNLIQEEKKKVESSATEIAQQHAATRPFCMKQSISTRTGLQWLLNTSLWRSKYTTADKCLNLCLFVHFAHCQYIPAHLNIGILLHSLFCVCSGLQPLLLLTHCTGEKTGLCPSPPTLQIHSWQKSSQFHIAWNNLFRELISHIHNICSKSKRLQPDFSSTIHKRGEKTFPFSSQHMVLPPKQLIQLHLL